MQRRRGDEGVRGEWIRREGVDVVNVINSTPPPFRVASGSMLLLMMVVITPVKAASL
jgi:hypothetical protein